MKLDTSGLLLGVKPSNITVMEDAPSPLAPERGTVTSGETATVEGEDEDAVGRSLPELGVRHCRCMFCGIQIRCEKEEDATAHLAQCPALAQQLAGKGPFTVPDGTIPQNDHPGL